MVRGTRVLTGAEAAQFTTTVQTLRDIAHTHGYAEVILPALWEQDVFVAKAGPAIVGQMYAFPDRAGRPICLIPEATAVVASLWRDTWSKVEPKPHRVYYVTRCYRYDRPQAGRYREFTQFGMEILGPVQPAYTEELCRLFRTMMDALGLARVMVRTEVSRGLGYYVRPGFEGEDPMLGAQKQVMGGGEYPEGVGMAIGVDRVCLSQQRTT